MKNSFKVKVNSEHEFQIDDQYIEDFDIISINQNNYHILHENKSLQAQILNAHFNSKSYVIKIENTEFHVVIKNTLDQLIDDMGFTSGSTKQIDSIKAPMPGLILEINVGVGQDIKENDTLLILEAMKMENVITSPRDGIVKSVLIKQGEAVEKNQVLIEFE